MGIRQTLNDKPVPTAIITGVVILLTLIALARSACSSGGDGVLTQEFFTIDDGKNYFPDDANKVTPFDYEGKPAYRAKVYRCADGTVFVSHLERYSDADKKRIEEAMSAGQAGAVPRGGLSLYANMEVKKPGDTEWVRMSASPEKFSAIMQPKCADGSVSVEPVYP